jgi:hypothetical protein
VGQAAHSPWGPRRKWQSPRFGFRRHVGAALLTRDRMEIGEIPTWGDKASDSRTARAGEADHERRVSAYLGRMTVLWLEVSDEPGPESLRACIEQNAIALLSNQLHPRDEPSPAWLGLHSPYAAIRLSGLWNVKHVEQRYEPGFLAIFAGLV